VITELDALVSPDVGIVHRVDEGTAPYDHPRLATAFAEPCDTEALFGAPLQARAGGAAADRASAVRAAIGEAVERYSATCVPRGRLRRARAGELGDVPFAGPEWLDGRGPDRPVDWVPGCRLRVVGPGEPAWVAASRAYLAGPEDPAPVAVPTSTGLAGHPEPWVALRAALLEVIERDAVMVTWLREQPVQRLATRLRWRTPGGEVRFDRAVERYELYRLPSPGAVPVVLAAAYGSAGQPPVAVGAAADPDPVRAARRALVEARQTFEWATRMAVAGTPVPADPAGLEDLAEHVAYYLDPARLGAFDFLRAAAGGTLELDLDDLAPPAPAESQCRTLVGRLADAGLAAFAVDVTSADVRSAGVWVVRAVVPGLYPLLVGRHAPEHPRVPRALALSRNPHPFP
jgi:ribosomal protein S12 methylthiotransferase accessory factor